MNGHFIVHEMSSSHFSAPVPHCRRVLGASCTETERGGCR